MDGDEASEVLLWFNDVVANSNLSKKSDMLEIVLAHVLNVKIITKQGSNP